jgi:thiosulfate/3-mercaptopyruvate sulfurtransferase
MNPRRFSAWIATCLLATAAYGAPTCGGHGNKDTMIVSTAWLASHLKDPNLVIISIGAKPDYDKEHIPGALFLMRDEVSTPMEDGKLMLELPPMDQLQKNFAAKGVSNGSRIVLYMASPNALSITTRVYLTLDAMGLGAQTSILDGGLQGWKSESRPVTTEVRTVTPGKLEICPQSDVIASADWVHSNVQKPGAKIIDARTANFYSGEASGQNHNGSAQRAGHIPGAGNIPFSSLIDDKGYFLKPEQLREKFTAAGAKQGERVVSYCHIGQQATVVYFTARYLGYDARLFDGSFEDWNAHADWPVEK